MITIQNLKDLKSPTITPANSFCNLNAKKSELNAKTII